MLKKAVMIFGMVLLVAGCSIKPAKVVYMKPNKNHKVNVYSFIEQDALEAIYVVQSTSNDNANAAAENVAIINKELSNFNFDKTFEDELVSQLKGAVDVNNVITVKSQKELNRQIINEDNYVLLTTSYKMDVDFRTPIITTQVQIIHNETLNPRYKKNKKEKKIRSHLLYRNYFTYFGLTLPPAADIAKSIEANGTVDKDRYEKERAAKAMYTKNSAEIIRIQAQYDSLSKRKKKDPQVQAKYYHQLKALGGTYTSANKEWDILIPDADAKILARAWSIAHKQQLIEALSNGIKELAVNIDNDIQDKTLPNNYGQGTSLSGLSNGHKSIRLNSQNDRVVVRFTEGARAGSICSMPKDFNEGKLMCL